MLKLLPIALLAALAISCSSLPPEVPIPNSEGKTEDGHSVVVFPEGGSLRPGLSGVTNV